MIRVLIGIVPHVAGNPSGPALSSVKNVIRLAGGAAIFRAGNIVAAIGIDGE